MSAVLFIIVLVTSFVFAMLGLGGGMVYVPMLKWAGLDLKQMAIPLGLLLNGLNTLLVLIPYHRARLVDYQGSWPMGLMAMLLAPVGAYVTKFVSNKFLIIFFTVAVLAAALKILNDVLRPFWQKKYLVATDVAVETLQQRPPLDETGTEILMPIRKRMLFGGALGAGIGFLGGLLGVGGGFIVAPVLMTMGYPTKQAAATTAFVVTFSSFSGYLGHMAGGQVFTWLMLWLVVAVAIGSQLGGNFMAKKAKPAWVKSIYGVILLLISAKLIVEMVAR
ncbi:sulfite exporter TauE/SafE family protein [Phosphitispora fastidiosa]|uniref:sulfite exporter TauE/SafE family protein n=1 Tax=Phosphitispora fastidiosa TaxID=2837202 RepID=UPI001E3F667C|nr:sulfite exporter TauE/SafE family protein [Phosphitispora fastidiosa]MBU7006524.1 putative membrane protein YfcA [Phosphitispora fastidiosa]